MIRFSEEQAMLLDTAREFCQKRAPIDAVRQAIQAGQPLDATLWQTMVDLGWLGVTIPEIHGGLGLDLADTVPIFEAMGRQLLATPLLASTLAAQVLIANGNDDQKNQWLPKIAAGQIATVALTEANGAWDADQITTRLNRSASGEMTLTGSKAFVLDAGVADVILVSALQGESLRWCLVDVSELPDGAIQREAVIDETRRSYSLVLSDLSIQVDQILPGTVFTKIELAAMLLITAEMSGGLEGVLAVIVGYLNTRKQFDRLIGSYQAMKHPTVDILMGAEMTRSYLYHAATVWRDETDLAVVESAVRMAKCCASEQFSEAGDRGIQFHGGFGFTYECDAQLFLRRALWSQYQFGDERHQRQKLSALLF